MWVVKGISRGLIEARMDQASQTVTVTRAVSRDFGDQQWTALQVRQRVCLLYVCAYIMLIMFLFFSRCLLIIMIFCPLACLFICFIAVQVALVA